MTTSDLGSRVIRLTVLSASVLTCLSPAHAHGSDAERGLVMLLPTGYYFSGGAFAIVATFAVLAVLPADELEHTIRLRGTVFRIGAPPLSGRLVCSSIAALFWGLLVLAGFIGSRDPLANPLPTMFWTVWWVAFTLLHAVFGNLWRWFNPWNVPLALIESVSRGRLARKPLLLLPAWVGYWPSIVIFFAFAWFELISLAPSDPTELAKVIATYWCLVLGAMILFGREAWSATCEPFSVLFGLIGSIAPLRFHPSTSSDDGRVLTIEWPGRAFVDRPALPFSGILFVLLALASVSFDGMSRTFLWLDLIGINPLEFPGRSGVVLPDTLGLLGTFVALAGAFFASVYVGCRIAGSDVVTIPAAGRLIYSIIPISIGFHAAHYLTSLILDGQFAVVALSDPYARGWDLLHVGSFQPTASFFNNIHDVTTIWNVQALIICIAHVVGIIMAHSIASHLFDVRKATVSQCALAALMVFYTVFGLWLLSTPTGA
jgi:hypothetical protein